jgi:hypothetical protein
MLARTAVAIAVLFVGFAPAWLLDPSPRVSLDPWATSLLVGAIAALSSAYWVDLKRADERDAGVRLLKAIGALVALASAFIIWEGSVEQSPAFGEEVMIVLSLVLGIGLGLAVASEGLSVRVKAGLDWFFRRNNTG